MKIKKKHISDLNPAQYNPRVDLKSMDKKTYEKLKNSIERFGFVQPIIWNERTKNIVGGHQRLTVLKDLGIEELDVIVVDLDEKDEKALNIALNKIMGDWDLPKLNVIFQELDKDMDLLKYTGFDNKEIDKILDQFKEAEEDKFDVGKALEKKPKYDVSHGDVFLLGNHRIMCGDSTNENDMEILMKGDNADMVFTDPPYNVNLKHRGKRPAEIQEWKEDYTDNQFKSFLVDMYKYISKYLKAGGVYYICQGWRSFHLNIIAIEQFPDLLYHQALVWHKMWPVMGRTDYLKDFELIIYGWKKGKKHFFMHGLSGDTDVWVIKKDNPLKYVHLTQKPLEISMRAIKNSSMHKNIVLDLFGGSGGTLLSCEQTNRRCYMMELNPHYCSVIIERWESFTGKKYEKEVK